MLLPQLGKGDQLSLVLYASLKIAEQSGGSFLTFQLGFSDWRGLIEYLTKQLQFVRP